MIKNLEAIEKYVYSFFNTKSIGQCEMALKSLIKIVNTNNKKMNTEYKQIILKTLLSLSCFIDYNKVEKYKLREMFQFLITKRTALLDVIEDLERAMLSSKSLTLWTDEKNDLEIINPLAFESYLY